MLTQARLKEVLHYDPETGAFTWIVSRGRSTAGSQAGYEHGRGYLQIKVDGKIYLTHRLAVFYMTGKWPADEVDHKGRDPANNRWGNLRQATRAQNGANRWVQSNNKLGVKGVSINRRGKFVAQIQVNGKNIYLGSFTNADEAGAAYLAAAQTHFGEFANSGSNRP